jgi:DNA-binding response OmpR family regulator
MERIKVLLVDDEAEFVTTLAERLRIRSVDAIVAMDGEEALAKVETERPSVVVLDVMMPGMSGVDVLKEIKRRYPDIQIILLTGRGSTQEGIEGMKLGAFDFLMKPVKIEELMKIMDGAFNASVRARRQRGDS